MPASLLGRERKRGLDGSDGPLLPPGAALHDSPERRQRRPEPERAADDRRERAHVGECVRRIARAAAQWPIAVTP